MDPTPGDLFMALILMIFLLLLQNCLACTKRGPVLCITLIFQSFLRIEDAVEICCVLIWLSCVPQAAIGMIRPISMLTLRGQGGSGQKVGLDL